MAQIIDHLAVIEFAFFKTRQNRNVIRVERGGAICDNVAINAPRAGIDGQSVIRRARIWIKQYVTLANLDKRIAFLRQCNRNVGFRCQHALCHNRLTKSGQKVARNKVAWNHILRSEFDRAKAISLAWIDQQNNCEPLTCRLGWLNRSFDGRVKISLT